MKSKLKTGTRCMYLMYSPEQNQTDAKVSFFFNINEKLASETV